MNKLHDLAPKITPPRHLSPSFLKWRARIKILPPHFPPSLPSPLLLHALDSAKEKTPLAGRDMLQF